MLHDSPSHLSNAAWSRPVCRSERLERCLVVSLCFRAFLQVQQGLFKSIGICRPWRIIPVLPERQDASGDGHAALYGETGIAGDKYLGLLGEQELCSSRAQVHFLDDRQHFLLCATNVDSKVFWLQLDGAWLWCLPDGRAGKTSSFLSFLHETPPISLHRYDIATQVFGFHHRKPLQSVPQAEPLKPSLACQASPWW